MSAPSRRLSVLGGGGQRGKNEDICNNINNKIKFKKQDILDMCCWSIYLISKILEGSIIATSQVQMKIK